MFVHILDNTVLVSTLGVVTTASRFDLQSHLHRAVFLNVSHSNQGNETILKCGCRTNITQDIGI